MSSIVVLERAGRVEQRAARYREPAGATLLRARIDPLTFDWKRLGWRPLVAVAGLALSAGYMGLTRGRWQLNSWGWILAIGGTLAIVAILYTLLQRATRRLELTIVSRELRARSRGLPPSRDVRMPVGDILRIDVFRHVLNARAHSPAAHVRCQVIAQEARGATTLFDDLDLETATEVAVLIRETLSLPDDKL